jgi:phosphomannomutase
VAADHYAGRQDRIIDLHTMHIEHIKQFLIRREMITTSKSPLSIGYSAFNGSGRKAVPRLLSEIGFREVRRIMKLDALDGMFPAFCSDPGREQQPDPGDWRAADIAVEAFKTEYPKHWESVDLLVGTDPDADRCGVIVKVPEPQRIAFLHRGTGRKLDYSLLSADEAWTLILWYRLQQEIETHGRIRDAEKKFIVLSHTTTDLLTCLARKHGLGVLKTWVGFAQLAAGTRAAWDLSMGRGTPGLTEGTTLPEYDEGRTAPNQATCNRTIHSWIGMNDRKRCINIAALEQSNGFTLLGDVPPDERSLGRGGHVRDKDGTFAAVLVAELAQYAKDSGTNLIDLMDEKIYSDPDIGLYATHYEPDPIDGEYEGLAGYTKKREILRKAEALFDEVRQTSRGGSNSHSLGGLAIVGATVYPTGKYDAINYPGFPDEGYRFYFDVERKSHLTIRPSGTSNALRFHVQLFGGHPARASLIAEKAKLRETAGRIVEDIRARIGAKA